MATDARSSRSTGPARGRIGLGSVSLALAVLGVGAAVLGLLLYRDGDPDLPVFVSVASGPLAVAAGVAARVAGRRWTRRALAGTAIGAVVTAFWTYAVVSLLTGPL